MKRIGLLIKPKKPHPGRGRVYGGILYAAVFNNDIDRDYIAEKL